MTDYENINSNLKSLVHIEQVKNFGSYDDHGINLGQALGPDAFNTLPDFNLSDYLGSSDNIDNHPIPDFEGRQENLPPSITSSPINQKNFDIEDIVSDGACVSQVRGSNVAQVRGSSAIIMPSLVVPQVSQECDNSGSLIPMFGCILVAIIYRFFFV